MWDSASLGAIVGKMPHVLKIEIADVLVVLKPLGEREETAFAYTVPVQAELGDAVVRAAVGRAEEGEEADAAGVAELVQAQDQARDGACDADLLDDMLRT
jgi:hypothetical protein